MGSTNPTRTTGQVARAVKACPVKARALSVLLGTKGLLQRVEAEHVALGVLAE